jgi:FkbM family methyltransferase
LYGSNEADVGPFRIRFDPRDRLIAKRLALYGEFEKHEIALLCSLVQPGDSALDVGANIGLYSLYLSRAVGPKGRVVAVEPDPDNIALLRSNLENNGCDNVIVLPCALGAESGPVKLFQVEENRGNLSLADVVGTGRFVQVPMRRGDEALAELGLQPTVVKIDVEGAEPLVLCGLGYEPPVLLFEFDPSLLYALGHDPVEFLKSLVARGYRLDLIDPDNGNFMRDTPTAIAKFVGSQRNCTYNILARL